jgi:hypothetical protein
MKRLDVLKKRLDKIKIHQGEIIKQLDTLLESSKKKLHIHNIKKDYPIRIALFLIL